MSRYTAPMADRTDTSPAWPRALALRFLPTRGGRLALLALLALPVVLVDGVRSMDADLPGFLAGLARGGAAVPAERGFLLEGLLTDGVGAGLARLGVPLGALALAWWGLGLLLLAAVLALSLRRGELAFRDLLLLVAFSHLVDTLALWVGKFDPWLMAFLVLSAWRAPAPALAGSVLAAACHPILAVLSTAGVAAVDFALERRIRWAQAVAVAVAAGADLAVVHRVVPGLVDRTGYAENLATGLLHDAALLALPTLVSAALVPFALVRHFAGPFGYGRPAGGRGARRLGGRRAVRGLRGDARPHAGAVPAHARAHGWPSCATRGGAARWSAGIGGSSPCCCCAAWPSRRSTGTARSPPTPYPLAPWSGP